VAKKVALQAQKDGAADKFDAKTLEAQIEKMMWVPEYRPYRRAERASARPPRAPVRGSGGK
jgi:RNA processing factor Prp31